MQHVNLLDYTLLPARPWPSATALAVVFVAVSTAVGAHGLYESRRLAQALAQTPAEEPGAPLQAVGNDALAGLQHRVAQKQALLDVIQAQQSLPPEPAGALAALMAILPDAAWLTDVELQGARGVRIAGGVLDPAALLVFARRLGTIPALGGLPMQTVRLVHDEGSQLGDDDARPPMPPSHRFVLANVESSAEAPR
jgi:hypothetical protein